MKDASDADLLREYAEHGDEGAFREVVLRHTDLLYSAALRQAGSPDLARDLVQNVFVDLARKAGALSGRRRGRDLSEASVLGWLYRGLRFEAANLRRQERRRQVREIRAMEQFEPSSSPGTAVDWDQVRPVLDAAMEDLEGPDRDALLLRYFRNQDLASVGAALGVSDDAAQKRVSRALERLRQAFVRRGLTTSGVALSAVLSTHAVHAAPAGLALSLAASATSLAGASVAAGAGISTGLSQTLTMTTLQKILVGATLVAAVGTGVYEARQAAHWRETAATREAGESALAARLQESEQAREAMAREAGALRAERARAQAPSAELLRLRGEVARLRAVEQQVAQLRKPEAPVQDPFTRSVLDLTTRAAELNRHLEAAPHLRIPELALLNESDWLEAAKMAKLGTDEEVKESLMQLRGRAKHNAYGLWQEALKGYLDANGGVLPTETQQLKPYFKEGIDDAMLQRYRMTRSGAIPGDAAGPVWVIEEIAPVDPVYDTRMRMGLGSLDIAVITAGR